MVEEGRSLDRAIISASKPREGQRFWLYRDGLSSQIGLRRAGTCKASSHESYAELAVTTNFSFLRGASHPGDFVEQAAELGYAAIGIADRNSLAGVVRAYEAWTEAGQARRRGC